jgi:mRNA interferase MazF
LVKAGYVPDAGDLVWISADPQQGREQAGRQPFLVLSRRIYNAKTSLLVGVPVTSLPKGRPFEVQLAPGGSITGVALSDQVKSLDWRARIAEYAESVSPLVLRDVRSLISTLLDLR